MSEEASPATIMVVDDTPENLDLLRDMLQRKGYRVQAFPRGAMALKAAQTVPPDLILLDVMMPEMNGFEVCKRLKADAALKEIPVLFLSALTDTADKVQAFAAGGVDYVTKPFQGEEVNARVKAHLELHRQRRELQEAYDKLRELETLRDDLTHMIVHDMRSPLTVAKGGLDLLRELIPGDEEETLELWRETTVAVHELTLMCNGVLDVSRLEAGQMSVLREPCDLSVLAAEAVAAILVQAKSARLMIHTELEPVRVSADRGLLQRILVNLLTNAIKHTSEHCTITVRSQPMVDGVRVEVTDTGPGIPLEYQKRIFEKFGQVESRKEGQKHSSGLGLTFCKLAVEAHGGTIGVESEGGRGSTFWFTLPKGSAE
jgi:signal transduction histidine kinase